ncbi:MAG: type III secretion system inner membrane ring subunit SctD [Puniceicoccales bacterium]|jgi:type III secretion system YscD/HrpQ family protein|nr:type III secretion system inner membrane ring subunit SctD [Puniceicoccales bacterium]
MSGSSPDADVAPVRAFLLRFLSGPHAGAEVELDSYDQQIAIGSDEECDLVLEDALVMPQHALIQFSNGKLSIKSLGGRIFVNGKWVRDGEATIQPFQFVTVGTTHIVAGPVDEVWPQISVSDAPPMEKITDETPADALTAAHLDAVDPHVVQMLHETKAKQRKHLLRRLVISGIVVLILGGGLLLTIPQKKTIKPYEIERFVRAEVADLDYTSTVTVRMEGGRLVVDGYVPTNAELRGLKERITPLYTGIQFRVRSDEKIIRNIEEIMGDTGDRLHVSSIAPGVYSITGYLYAAEDLQKVRNQLAQGIPGVKKIQIDVMTAESASLLAASTLEEFGLKQQISIHQEFNRIVFRGSVSALQAEKWRSAAENIIRKFGDIVPIEFDVQALSAQSDPAGIAFFAQPIQSITIGSTGLNWITVKGGQKYFEGSFLSSGWRIDAISTSGLKFSRDGNQVSLRLEALR